MKRRKNESAYQYSLRLLESRQAKLQAEIGRLEREGYIVSEHVKRQVENLTKGVRSERQARQRLNLYKAGRIKSNLYKKVASQDIIDTTQAGQAGTSLIKKAPDVLLRAKYEGPQGPTVTTKEKAEVVLKGLKYEFSHHPSIKGADTTANWLAGAERATGVKLLPEDKGLLWARRNLPQVLSNIKPSQLEKVLENLPEEQSEQLLETTFNRGHATPEGYKTFINIAVETGKETFKLNFKDRYNSEISDKALTSLYDMFENSKKWQQFRSKYKGMYNLEEISEFLSNSNMNWEAFDKALNTAVATGSLDIDTLVSEYNSNL